LHVVPSMPARKALMAERSDAFLALLGGFGTFKAVMEILTWSQLGLHRKGVGFLPLRPERYRLRAPRTHRSERADDGRLERTQLTPRRSHEAFHGRPAHVLVPVRSGRPRTRGECHRSDRR
jgi:hypothetical protein